MNNDEFYEYEDRAYINPTLSSGEQEAFIDNLRDIQGKNTAQIAQQTYNLGTNVPSNLGGLGGGEAYFTSRYQVPQVNEMTSTLKSAAQAQALQDVMSNYQAQLKEQYNQAYRKAQKRQRARQNALAAAAAKQSGSGQGLNNLDVYDSGEPADFSHGVGGGVGYDTPAGTYTTEAVDLGGQYFVQRDQSGNIINTNQPGYKKWDDGYYHSGNQPNAFDVLRRLIFGS